jgi:hypothetical protein
MLSPCPQNVQLAEYFCVEMGKKMALSNIMVNPLQHCYKNIKYGFLQIASQMEILKSVRDKQEFTANDRQI